MFWKKSQGPSIRRQLLLSLIGPLLLLSVACALLSNWLALQLANEIYDELLFNTLDSVVARIDYIGGKRVFDFPKSAQAIFRHQDKDQFYYKVYTQDGIYVYGDADLPALAADPSGPVFADGTMRGETIRMVSILNQVPDQIEKPLVVTVAETCNARVSMAQKILLAIILTLLLVVSGGAASLWTGINSGLAPLHKIRVAMSMRSPTELTPVTIEHAPREVLPMLEAINALLTELRVYIASQSRFVSDAAHQLRTPIAGLKTFVDLGAMQANDERSIKIFEQLNQGVGRLTQMTNGLLALARAEASSDRFVKHQPVDLNEFTRETVDALSHVWKSKSTTKISFHPCAQPALINASEESLRDLVENLVNNAFTYTQDGGQVNVSLSTAGGVELIVEDNGPGIPEGEREKIFERFYRIDRSTNAFGCGLGLAIVKEIADHHAAKIAVVPGKNGVGCRFVVTFPAQSTERLSATGAKADVAAR